MSNPAIFCADVGSSDNFSWIGIMEGKLICSGEGRGADGICTAIESIGAQLAAAFPPRPDDTDELTNTVRTPERP